MVESPSTPTTPNYIAPASYTAPASYVQSPYTATLPYASPGDYPTTPNPNSMIPQANTLSQTLSGAQQVESSLPSWLRLGNENPLDPKGLAQYQNNYTIQNVDPALAADTTALASNGQIYGSFGGAQLGAQQSAGQLNAYNASLSAAQQYYNDQIQGRDDYFNNDIGTTVNNNSNAISRGEAVNSAYDQIANNQANYNLSASGAANQYNQNQSNSQNAYNESTNAAANSYNTGLSNSTNSYNIGTNNSANDFDKNI